MVFNSHLLYEAQRFTNDTYVNLKSVRFGVHVKWAGACVCLQVSVFVSAHVGK